LLLQVVKLHQLDSPEGAIEMRPDGICVYLHKSYTLESNQDPEALEDEEQEKAAVEGEGAARQRQGHIFKS